MELTNTFAAGNNRNPRPYSSHSWLESPSSLLGERRGGKSSSSSSSSTRTRRSQPTQRTFSPAILFLTSICSPHLGQSNSITGHFLLWHDDDMWPFFDVARCILG